ncbi:hypothetical protein A8U91_02259 [Halomonas elongata]|uniref:Uncharacterized protein n=1 Tax=Halomonas elongata TaxID=2746 RepID=A0A1B8P6M4_HALEL|nr:TolC family protein [Halomonas elongata]OBX37880.1 hypothetical protein A8U91_02259 [Halomonas elongata]
MRRFPLSPLAAAMVLLCTADVTLAGTQASPSSFLGRVETREAATDQVLARSTGEDAAIWQEANTALSGPADAQMTSGAGPAADTISIPSLPGLFERALNADADLQAQRLRAEARGQDVPKARAGLLPRLDASYVYRYTDSDNIYTTVASPPARPIRTPVNRSAVTPMSGAVPEKARIVSVSWS